MWKTRVLAASRRGLVLASALLMAPACTGVASLPAGSPTGPGEPGGPPINGQGGAGMHTGTGAGGAPAVPPGDLDPGRVVLRRLNRAEYNNTVRDLLGTMTKPADKFAATDNVNDGFDTLGNELDFSDVLVEDIEGAAGVLVDELLARPKADPLRTRILVCEPTAANAATCINQILTAFMRSAYRRPVIAAEVQDLVMLATTIQQSSGDVMRGLHAALKTVLLSPHFMFHVEMGDPASAQATPLDDYELASRLSYFLWSSMPDQPLMQAAADRKLTPVATDLKAQVDRMIRDPKSQALVDNFGGQWLSIREVNGVVPAETFTTFDESLRTSMPQETSLFFKSLVADAAPLKSLLLADFSFINDRLARHYGLPAAQPTYARVSLTGTQRLGILTQETFLTVTSQPDRTSPVKRGNWVLEKILCDPPMPPPPGIEPLVTPAKGSGLTVRAVLEEHRKNIACAGCHNAIDPIGLALENYDAIGAYRTTDNGQPIVPTGMIDKKTINGASELAHWLADDPRFVKCMVQQALTYAVGRSFSSPEAKSYVAAVAAPLTPDSTWPDLLQSVVSSKGFLTRRGEAP